MHKCRICLRNKKTLISIFENSKNITLADMICSIANVKIIKDDKTADKICCPCQRSLKDAYEFKLHIERSDAVINENAKKFKFNNINDVKLQIEIEVDNKSLVKKCKETNLYNEDEFCYNDTVIRKVINKNTDDVCNRPVPVLEFLRTLKDEPDNYNFHHDSIDMDCYGIDLSDDDYIPPHKLLNNGKISKQKSISKKESKKSATEVCLKPVYLRHLKLVYSKPTGRPRIQRRKEDKLVCPYCGIMKRSLKSHLLLHTGDRKYKCCECGKAFFTEGTLNQHIKGTHAKTKDYKCEKCTASFTTRSSLLSHEIMHDPNRNYVCDICNKTFKRKGALRRHHKMHNSANKTVMCDLCNMSFFNKPALRHHLRIHTGERPYNCEICSQPYSYKHDFNRHCLKKHGVCFKRRSVYVMNEEILKQERILMKDLMLRVNGVIKDDKPLNPFEGPQAALAFEQTLKALEAKKISIDF